MQLPEITGITSRQSSHSPTNLSIAMKHVVFFLFLFIPLLAQAQDPRYEKFMASGDRELRAGNYPLAGKKYTAALEFAFSSEERTAAHAGVKKAEQLRVREVERERDRARTLASQADTLRQYLQGDSTYDFFLNSGIAKFREGRWEEAQYDLAIARFTHETPEVMRQMRFTSDALLARRLALSGWLDDALAIIKSVIDRDTLCYGCRDLQRVVRKCQNEWEAALAGRASDKVDSLRFQDLVFLPHEIDRMTNLQVLILRIYPGYTNRLSIPIERWTFLDQMTNLKSLSLVNNDISKLSFEFGQLTKLQFLDLSNNTLSELPPEFGQLINLQSLNLGDNDISILPPEFGQLINLQSLDLSNNKLLELPPEFGQLINLQSLDLSGNDISKLPSEFGQLRNLQSLNLTSKLSPESWEVIGQLPKLQSLDLSGNGLSDLPPEFDQLINLRSLDLSGNKFSDNGLFKLPPESWTLIGKLPKLQSLDLSTNQLSKLPPNDWKIIGELTNLRSLDLSGNGLFELPPELGQLTNLQSLDLTHNELFKLSVEGEGWKIIGQLTNLQSLNLRENSLTQLSPEIGKLINLDSLNLLGNLLQLPP